MKNRTKTTLLHKAASRDPFDPVLCNMLLDGGADLFALTNSGRTVMHHVKTIDGYRFMRKAGLEPDHDPAVAGSGYLTPFQHWVVAGEVELVRHCLEEGAVDIGQTTRAGKSLFQLADSPEILALLRSAKTQCIIEAELGGVVVSGSHAERSMSAL